MLPDVLRSGRDTLKKMMATLATVGLVGASTSAMAFNLNDVNRAMEAMNTQGDQTTTTQQSSATAQQQSSDLSSRLGQVVNQYSGQSRQQEAAVVGTTSDNLGQATELVNQLTSQLGVSKTQAIGGSAALLAAAKSQLGSDQFNQLSNQAPGVDGLLSSAQTLSGSSSMLSRLTGGNSDSNNTSSLTSSAFSMLGMDTSMISQFAPVMLSYLGGQGVSGSLLSSLTGIWGAGSQ